MEKNFRTMLMKSIEFDKDDDHTNMSEHFHDPKVVRFERFYRIHQENTNKTSGISPAIFHQNHLHPFCF